MRERSGWSSRIAVGLGWLALAAGCDCGGRVVQPDAGDGGADAAALEDAGGLDHAMADGAPADRRGSDVAPADTAPVDTAVAPPIVVDNGPDQQSVPKVAALPEGGAWVSYFSQEQGEYRVRLQRLDAEGQPQLGARGLLVSDKDSDTFTMDQQLLVADDGDAILIFQDIRSGHYEGYAYRFASDTTPHWGADGVRLFAEDSEEIVIDALLADDGELVVAAERVTASGSLVALQRLTSDGRAQWGADGLQIDASAAGRTCTRPRLARAGGGGVFVAWMDTPNLMSTQRQVRVRRLDSQGAPAWSADVQLSTLLDIPIQFPLELEEDGDGGLWVAWTVAEGPFFHVMLQHLDAAGDPKLGLGGPGEGIPLSTSTTRSQLYPVLAHDSMLGELVAFWQELSAAQDRSGVSAQSFGRVSGARRFADEGAVVVGLSELRLVPGAARAPGGVGLVVYSASTPLSEVSNFHVAAVDLAAEPALRTLPITDSQGAKAFGFVSRELVDPAWMVWMEQSVDDGDIHAVCVPTL